MVKKPLVLYLDTSDISHFADLGSSYEKPGVAETYATLCSHIERHEVEVRYSCIHIAEIGKSGSKDIAHRKATVIETLCGDRCFQHFADVWKREVWLLVQASIPRSRFAIPYLVSSNDGSWMTSASGILDLDLDAEVKRALRALPLNNAQRRAAKAHYLRRGRLTKRLTDHLDPHASDAVIDIAENYSITDADGVAKLITMLLSGAINRQAFEAEFRRQLLRPTQMIRFIFEMDEIRRHFPRYVVAFGESMARSVLNLRTRISDLPQSERRRVGSYVPDTILRGPAVKAALDDRRRIRGAKLADQRVEKIACSASIGALPAIDLISKAAQVYASQHASMQRKPQVSDGPDFMHLTYLPYSDLFRADTYMVNLLKQCGPLVSATLVRNLDELPAMIERALAPSGGPADASTDSHDRMDQANERITLAIARSCPYHALPAHCDKTHMGGRGWCCLTAPRMP